MDIDNQIYLSVVIPTKNSLSFLKYVVPSILSQQNSESIEVILADNCSEDGTETFAKSIGCRIIKVEGKAPQACRQRNEGIYRSKGKYILILDHDMELASDFYFTLKHQLSHQKDRLAWYIPEQVRCGSLVMTQVRNFENILFAETPIAATRLFHQSVFEKVGYYDESLSDGPGDWDFDMRIHQAKIPISSVDSYVIHHEEVLTLKSYIDKKFGYIAGSLRYKSKWMYDHEMTSRLRSQFSPLYRIFGFVSSRKKIIFVLSHPVQYGLYILVTAAKAIQYIRYKYSL